MQKDHISQAGLFNSRVLLAFALCSVGVFVAPVSFAAGPFPWSFTGTMVTPRQNHTATVISGCKVLVVGGDLGTDHSIQATALLYDIAIGTWRSAGTMHAGREFHTATRLPPSQPTGASKVLVAGGIGNDGVPLATAEVDDPPGNFNTGVWSLTGSMSTARYAHTATLLSSGKVLIAGGIDANGASLASAELYDPAAGTWSTTGSMLTARYDQSAVVLTGGQVLVTGGIGPGGAILSSAELYDPTTGTWSAAGNMTAARIFHTATVLTTGFVLINGGRNSSGVLASAELYNPVAGEFTATGSMNLARQFHTASILFTGQVLVAGGKDSSSALSTAELYEPGAGVWLTTGSMASARQFHTASPLPSFGVCGTTNGEGPTDLVLVAGGTGPNGVLAAAELYQPATGTWSATTDMSTGRFTHAAALLFNGKVLVAGGTTTTDRGALASALLYDPATGTFSATGSMGDGRSQYTLTLLPGGKVLAAGGFGSDSNALASAALYDPATGKWSPTAPLSQARYAHTATLLFSGKVLVSGGRSGGQRLSSAELYDPVGGTWNSTGSMSAARNLHTATLLNTGEVLVAGYVAPSELYHPATGTWSTTGDMNISRTTHTATLLPTGEVLVAGGGNASAELYNRTSDTWSIAQSMSTDRAAFPAVLLPNGTVLVAGGDTHLGPTAACEFYDPPSGTWTVIGNMNQDRDWHTGTLLNTGKVLVTGGLNLAGQVLASAELFDPVGPPLSLFSCDGVNVVTDPAGDAVNPAPGAAGPTDQADIVGISFSTDAPKTTLITTMTLHNLSQVPSPGTTSTTFNVVWTSSNGSQYATQVTAPDPSGSLSYFRGLWNPSSNKLTTFIATTGTFNQGANGTVTVNVPLSGIGNPTIPITDPSQTAAVTNPFGLTFAGEGALGNGLPFVSPMDVAPDSGAGARWAVCPPPPVQLVSVVSRKVHGSAGTFDIDLPLAGTRGIECRSGGANGDYTLVFAFANPLTSVGGASISSGTGSVTSSAIDSGDAHRYVINLTGVTNAQVITVSLTNVNDSAGNFSSTVSASMGVLIGDVNANGIVSNPDVASVKAQVTAPVTQSNFRNDVNANGVISNTDVGVAKARAGTQLP
jgi:hypothetical protein